MAGRRNGPRDHRRRFATGRPARAAGDACSDGPRPAAATNPPLPRALPPGGGRAMTVPDDEFLWRSVLRQTGRDRSWVGFWLRRYRIHERIGLTRLAARLGLDRHGLALLSLCG